MCTKLAPWEPCSLSYVISEEGRQTQHARLAPFSYLTLYCPIVNENSGPRRVTHHMFYSVQKIAVVQRKKRVVLILLHRISNPKSLISLQPTKAFMWLSWCASGIWGWEVFTTAHKVILAAMSPSQMGNIAFILRGAAPQTWISQKWCVTHLGAKILDWDETLGEGCLGCVELEASTIQ